MKYANVLFFKLKVYEVSGDISYISSHSEPIFISIGFTASFVIIFCIKLAVRK